MERTIAHISHELKENRLYIPDNGILLHGTSKNRASHIKNEGFNPLNAEGDCLDRFASHFFYYNPETKNISSRMFFNLRLCMEEVIDYARWASRNDLFSGDNPPVVILVEKPSDLELTKHSLVVGKRIPTAIQTTQLIEPESIIDVIELENSSDEVGHIFRTLPLTTRKDQNVTMLKIWGSLVNYSHPSEPQSPDQG